MSEFWSGHCHDPADYQVFWARLRVYALLAGKFCPQGETSFECLIGGYRLLLIQLVDTDRKMETGSDSLYGRT